MLENNLMEPSSGPVPVACTSGDSGASVVPNWLDSWSVDELQGFQ
jgi:hypothetical protein